VKQFTTDVNVMDSEVMFDIQNKLLEYMKQHVLLWMLSCIVTFFFRKSDDDICSGGDN